MPTGTQNLSFSWDRLWLVIKAAPAIWAYPLLPLLVFKEIHDGSALGDALHSALEPHLWALALGALLTLPELALSLALALSVEKWFPPKYSSFDPTVPPWAVEAAIVAALGGTGEELLCRGILQASFAAVFGNIAALSIVSVFFGLMHYPMRWYWGDVFRTFIPGLVFGLLFLITGNLWVCIVLHAAGNFLVLTPPVHSLYHRLRIRHCHPGSCKKTHRRLT